ncbi:hypothetical protein PTKIN_Ptkin05aG0080400 [Pterospermum kingtungense]
MRLRKGRERKYYKREPAVEIRRSSSDFAHSSSELRKECSLSRFLIAETERNRKKMKGSGPLVATMLAASTVALTSSSSAGINDVSYPPTSSNLGAKNGAARNCTASEPEKFAPRFDGLRFIETLVTAHR